MCVLLLFLCGQIIFSIQWLCKGSLYIRAHQYAQTTFVIIHSFHGFSLFLFQESQDESALLWLDEIQNGINDANNNIKEAAICEN